MTAPSAEQASLDRAAAEHTKGSRFLLSAIAFQRNRQLQGGSVARVARDGHKATYLAVLEVRADTVSWSRE
jgi:hypothetical protein